MGAMQRMIGTAMAVMLGAGCAIAQAPAQNAAPAARPAPAYPFLGKWDCEVATFTFTEKVYNNGSENMPIRKIVPAGKNTYRLDFDKGYKISVQMAGPAKMNWMSHESGDGFSCKRAK